MFANSKLLAFLEKEVERLQAELKNKDQQIMQLQAALVAKEAPGAYLDHFAPKDPMDSHRQTIMKNLMEEAKFVNKYTQVIENPLFDNPDQAIELLGKVIGAPKSKPIHNNAES